MSVEVYNFNDSPQTVTVSPKAFGGWSIGQDPQTVTVGANGRVSIPFTIHASDDITPGVDYPFVVHATLDARSVPPSVSRTQLATGEPGDPIDLAPSITEVSPGEGAIVRDPKATLAATVTDALSGIDVDRVRVEIDGTPVRHEYDPATGRLTADLGLAPGSHNIWIRASNNAHWCTIHSCDAFDLIKRTAHQ